MSIEALKVAFTTPMDDPLEKLVFIALAGVQTLIVALRGHPQGICRVLRVQVKRQCAGKSKSWWMKGWSQ